MHTICHIYVTPYLATAPRSPGPPAALHGRPPSACVDTHGDVDAWPSAPAPRRSRPIRVVAARRAAPAPRLACLAASPVDVAFRARVGSTKSLLLPCTRPRCLPFSPFFPRLGASIRRRYGHRPHRRSRLRLSPLPPPLLPRIRGFWGLLRLLRLCGVARGKVLCSLPFPSRAVLHGWPVRPLFTLGLPCTVVGVGTAKAGVLGAFLGGVAAHCPSSSASVVSPLAPLPSPLPPVVTFAALPPATPSDFAADLGTTSYVSGISTP